MGIITPTPWARQPQYPIGVNSSHPFGSVLDFVWNGGAKTYVDVKSAFNVPPASGTVWTPKPQGLAISNTGTAGSTLALTGKQKITGYPYVLFGYGYFLSSANTWRLSPFLDNSGGGYVAGIRLSSSTAVELALRYNYGTTRTIAITTGSGTNSGLAICAIAQVFSETDYRFYCNGQQTTGTLSPGTLTSLDRLGDSIGGTMNGGIWVSGYGSGRVVPDGYAKWLTANPQKIWQIFSPLVSP